MPVESLRIAVFRREYTSGIVQSIALTLRAESVIIDVTTPADEWRRYITSDPLHRISGLIASHRPLVLDCFGLLRVGELEPDCPLCLYVRETERTATRAQRVFIHRVYGLASPEDVKRVKWTHGIGPVQLFLEQLGAVHAPLRTRVFGIDPHKEVQSIRDRMSPPGFRAAPTEKKPAEPPPQQTWRDRPSLL